MAEPLVEFDRVSVVRGKTLILQNVSLALSHHEHCAILGPNGSGKSTLLKLLTRNMYPSVIDGFAGQVRVLGQLEWNVWELRSHLGFVSSEIDHHFLHGRSGRLSAMDAVLTGFFSSELEPDSDRVTHAMRGRASEALSTFEMDHLPSRLLGQMSTGERRRVMLARAMVTRPKALILDEPTSGLDIRSQRQLLHYLRTVAQSGTKLIMVTHHFEEIIPSIERTVLLNDGRVAFDGPTSSALASERIEELFHCPIEVSRDALGYYRAVLR